MIIVIGPRQSGKTTLTNTLALTLDLPVYDYSAQLVHYGRFHVDDIIKNVRNWPDEQFGIFDDHPFISEYIYGPLDRRGVLPDFYSHQIRPVLSYIWQSAIIIYCRPSTLHEDDPARQAYDLLFCTPLLTARILLFDHTNEHSLNSLISTLRSLLYTILLDRHHTVNGHKKRLWSRK